MDVEEREDLLTCEDNLYGESTSDESDDESEIAERLYEQAHYSSKLKTTDYFDNRNEQKDNIRTTEFPEILVDDSSGIILGAENKKKVKKKISHAVAGEDEEQWDVDDVDLELSDSVGNKTPSKRYYDNGSCMLPNIFCYNCGKKGHLQRDCIEPKKVPTCYLCGQTGHHRNFCPNDLCYNCLEPGHISKDCTEAYVNHWRLAKQRCTRCKGYGHRKKTCTEIWRQFHATTTPDSITKPYNPKLQNKKRFCYNCGSRKHFGEDCNLERYCKRAVYSQFVVSYDKCVLIALTNTNQVLIEEKCPKPNKVTNRVRDSSTSGERSDAKCEPQRSDKTGYVVLDEISEASNETPESSDMTENLMTNLRKRIGKVVGLTQHEAKKETEKSKTDEKRQRQASKDEDKANENILQKDQNVKKTASRASANIKNCITTHADKRSSKENDVEKQERESICRRNVTSAAQTMSCKGKVDVTISIDDVVVARKESASATTRTRSPTTRINAFQENLDFIPLNDEQGDTSCVVTNTKGLERKHGLGDTVDATDLSKKRIKLSKKSTKDGRKVSQWNPPSTTAGMSATTASKKKSGKSKEIKNREYDLDYVTLHNLRQILTDSEDDEPCDLQTRMESQRSSPEINIHTQIEATMIEDDEEEDLRTTLNRKHRLASEIDHSNQQASVDLTQYDPSSVVQEHLVAYGLDAFVAPKTLEKKQELTQKAVTSAQANAVSKVNRFKRNKKVAANDMRVIRIDRSAHVSGPSFNMSDELNIVDDHDNYAKTKNRTGKEVKAFQPMDLLESLPNWQFLGHNKLPTTIPNWKNLTKNQQKIIRKTIQSSRAAAGGGARWYTKNKPKTKDKQQAYKKRKEDKPQDVQPDRIAKTSGRKIKKVKEKIKRGFQSRKTNPKSSISPSALRESRYSFLPGIG